MRIGVVCEGPSDFHAIAGFFGTLLEVEGLQAEFNPIQPDLDRTQPVGGWGNVLLWFANNPPSSRIRRYFGDGLFGGELAVPPLDCIIVQLDGDILADASFSNHVCQSLGYVVNASLGADEKAEKIRAILRLAAKLDELTDTDRKRHILAPAIESTEAWCVAAFQMPVVNTEELSGQALIDGFMCALERSEGRQPTPPYAHIDKAVDRRKKFVRTHRQNADRVLQGCPQFKRAFRDLMAISTLP